jgi:spore coat polysaccharide biosynthesis protein SpsF
MNELNEKIPAFITVRSSSSRLPNKCFLPFGKMSVLEHVIQRTKDYGLEPIVCTTCEPEDDLIFETASKLNVKFFRGSKVNKLLRWRDCCREFGLTAFHSVDADDPFFCGDEVKRSYELLQTGFDMVAPSPSSSGGGATVGYSLSAEIIEKACTDLDENTDTEMMWYYIEKISNVKIGILDDIDENIPEKLRLTLDYEEDYWLLRSVQRMVGHFATRTTINDLFLRNPELYLINWFRNEEWAQGQLDKKI